MKRLWLLLVCACGSHAAPHAADASASEACQKARALRTAAQELESKGHVLQARAKLDEANAGCPDERPSTAPLETKITTALGDATVASKGTSATARTKMRQAFSAEHGKDFARAKTLYLEAWAELHPNPIALEAAGRAAGRAGDPVEARRLRDRALFEAESTEHATAVLTNRVRASVGTGRLVDGTLVIAQAGKVVARDLATGELRALLDLDTGDATSLSRRATLAFTRKVIQYPDTVEVVAYDLVTRSAIEGCERLAEAVASPDDKLLLARSSDGSARVIDVETGAVRAKLGGEVFAKLKMVGFDSKGRLLVFKPGEDQTVTVHDWDLEKNAFGTFAVTSNQYVFGFSASGRYMATLEASVSDDGPDGLVMPLVIRDLETQKTVAQWKGRFASLTGFDITSDASMILTKSNNSARLWTVADQKQTFVAQRTRRGDNYDYDLGESAFSDDAKTVVLGREVSTMLWDVATGQEKLAVSEQLHANVLGITPLPGGGIVVVQDNAVRVVPSKGDAHVLCAGYHQRYYPDVGPTSVALSPTGKSLACAMNTGTIHVFDTTTWEERSKIDGPAPAKTKSTMARYEWDGVPPSERPVDLSFSPDDGTLSVVSDDALASFDTHTGKPIAKVALRDAKLALVRRHARLPDGTIVIKTASGAGALFDATGKRAGDVALVPGAPLSSPDAFSADGKTYAVVVGKTLHRVGLDGSADRATDLPDTATSVALSPDGKACAVVLHDGSVQRVTDTPKKLDLPLPARRVFYVGSALVVVAKQGDTLYLIVGDEPPKELEVDPNGLLARSTHGTFEVRGQAEAECVIGRYELSEETCIDRAEPGLLDAWLGPHGMGRAGGGS